LLVSDGPFVESRNGSVGSTSWSATISMRPLRSRRGIRRLTAANWSCGHSGPARSEHAGARRPGHAIAAAVAAERAAIIASLIRLTGDWTLAEDCVQDAVGGPSAVAT
jgi:hypothetical protein